MAITLPLSYGSLSSTQILIIGTRKRLRIQRRSPTRSYSIRRMHMTEDFNSLLTAIADNVTVLQKCDSSVIDTAHAVESSVYTDVFSCLSGPTYSFGLDVGRSPRSQCVKPVGQNYYISWSDYNTRQTFFSTTWTLCNNDITATRRSLASCEDYGSSSDGGDVCLSNRATECK